MTIWVCETCGAVAPDGDCDVAVHDCDTDEWTLLTMRLPDVVSDEVEKEGSE